MARLFPLRYVPRQLTRKDRKRQTKMLLQSRNRYRVGQYVNRKNISFRNRPSPHVKRAKEMYGVEQIVPTAVLSRATGCSLSALRKIVRKGEGAYYSSGSRPNQTAQSWAYARLASALTGGKASGVDFAILDKGCSHTRKAYRLAKQARSLKS